MLPDKMKRLLSHTILTGSVLYVGAISVVSALPDGGVISFGAAEIRNAGSHTLVFQGSDRAVVDWRSFDVAPGEEVHFAQASAGSAILNRIHDTDASRIDGALTANGQVYLVNPNGMVFGHGAQVDVGSLVASTADISDSAFMQGGALTFDTPGNPNATIVNAGTITVKDGGLAALVAPNVENSGIITAKSGTVALASGDTMVVDFYGDDLLSVAVSDAVTRQSVSNTGTLSATDGGRVLMTTAQASSVIDSVINMNGIADASSATDEGGVIVFAGQDADITLGSNAAVKATGNTGGGTVRIGGEYQGKGATPTARTTTMKKGASIDASATGTGNGNGGEVILWSDDTTVFAGEIKATGGAAAPSLTPTPHSPLPTHNGGFIETSGKQKLYATGAADASAPYGQAGQWLLDPTNATISNGAGTDVSAGGTFSGQAAIDATTIQTALNNGTSVTISTTSGGGDAGDITLSNATIAKTADADATLTLKAENSILSTGSNSISSTTGKLGFVLWADSDGIGGGAISLNNTTINTNGGNFVAAGGLDNGANGGTASDGIPDNFATGTALNDDGLLLSSTSVTTGAGNMTLFGKGLTNAASSGHVGMIAQGNSALTATSGKITIAGTAGASSDSGYGIYLNGSGVSVTSTTGDITLTGQGNGTGANNRGIYLLNSSVISDGTGASAAKIVLNGTGGSGTDTNFGILLNGANTKITTKDGNVTLTGTSLGTGNSNYGLYALSGANVTTDGKGTLTLSGTGANGGTDNRGIYFLSGSTIKSNGTADNAGSITLTGTGGNGTNGNHGILFSGAGTALTTKDGNVTLTGTAKGTRHINYGVHMLSDANITTSGKGSVMVNGTGTDGMTDNRGIYLLSGSSIVSSSAASDAGGITLTGTGGNGTTGNFGIMLNGTNTRLTTKTGNIALTGTGRGTVDNNHGIYLASDADILSTDTATISLTGTAGTGASSRDLYASGATISVGGGTDSGNILLSFITHSLADISFQTSGNITLQPRDLNTSVGVAGGAGALDVSTALLGMLNAGGTLTVGRADGDGTMTVSPYASWSTRAGTGVRFLSHDGAITLAAGAHSFGARNVTLETDADPTITGTVTGTGTLTLLPSSTSQTMGVAGGAGTVNFSSADMTNLGTGWSAVNLGRTDGTGLLTQGAFSWFAPTTWRAAAAGAGVLVSAAQSTSAASNATFTFGAPVNLSANLDTSAATGGTRNVAFNGATTLGANATVNAGSGNVTFGSTLNGGQTLGVTTTGDVTFTGAAGGVTPLGNVTVTGAHDVAATGGMNSGGTISVTATNAITGAYTGTDGTLNAGAGTITATPSFTSLDIQGAGATLSAGYIGSAGAATQNMANLISIGGVSYPTLTPNAAYTFAGYTIGASGSSSGGGSGGGSGGSSGGAGSGGSSGGTSAGGSAHPTPPSTSPGLPGSSNTGSSQPSSPGSSSSNNGGSSPSPTQTLLSKETAAQLQSDAQRYDGSTVENTSDEPTVFTAAFSHSEQSFTQGLLEYGEELLEMIGCGAGNADESCQNL